MAINDKRQRKCFTYIWRLENASYSYPNEDDCVESPAFTVDEIHETKWKLQLYPTSDAPYMGFFLQRLVNSDNEIAEIDCEIAFLASDGTVLHSYKRENSAVEKSGYIGTREFLFWNEVLLERRSVFLPQDTLTVRCRIWKSVGDMSKDIQYLARTRIAVEKRSFLWNIENFSTLELYETRTCEIKSICSAEHLLSFRLFLSHRLISDEMLYLNILPNFKKTKFYALRLSIVDASKNTVKCFQDELWDEEDSYEDKNFALNYTRRELMENKSVYLPNDKLSFLCECDFSCGIALEEIQMMGCDSMAVGEKKPDNGSVNMENELPVPKVILINDFMSILNDNTFCDIKLKTSSLVYPAHKLILSARSPVFKAMFSNTMKVKIKDCVDIEDLNDDTVFRMLRYIYSADVGELEWASAIELYEAGDKYQILNLKDICSSYLKGSLCANNVCEALILADLHQDEDLKGFVEDFILSHMEEIINSEEWEQLAATNLKLAYETMRLKFKKQLK